MLKSFLSRPNILVRLLVVLVFAGGLVFAATYDGFSPKIQAESGKTDAAPTEEPVAQTEASGCGCSGTDALLADGTATQPEISDSLEEPTPAQANACSRSKCRTSNCHGGTCTKGCTSVPRCEDSCSCPTSCCSRGDKCSGYGRCGGSSSSCTSS